MYSIWEPSNHGEKARIVAKFGKVVSLTTSSLTILPPPLDLDAQPVSNKSFAIVRVEHGPSLQVALSYRQTSVHQIKKKLGPEILLKYILLIVDVLFEYTSLHISHHMKTITIKYAIKITTNMLIIHSQRIE